jgi:hypothetical protein
MGRISARSIWLQSIVCLVVIVGVIAGDITVAQARVAAEHKKAAIRKLHRAEAAYVAQVDAISRDLFANVQPVQNALDQLDATRPQYLEGARDAVVNSATAATVKRLDARLAKLRPTTTLTTQHKALQSAIRDMTKHLGTLERGKKSKDSADLLDEPYSGATLNLSLAEDNWQTALAALDTATHRPQAPSPGSAGSARPHAALPASKASWIFGADHACSVAGHSFFLTPAPSSSASLGTLAKFEDRYATIVEGLSKNLRKLTLPARDRTYLNRAVYRNLHANDLYAQAARETARAARTNNATLAQDALAKFHLTDKGMSALSHSMTSYGATFCGLFFNPNGIPTTSKSGGSGTISA